MDCGHLFCDDCWRQHLRIQITEGNSRRLPCMGIKCGVICDEVKARTAALPMTLTLTPLPMKLAQPGYIINVLQFLLPDHATFIVT